MSLPLDVASLVEDFDLTPQLGALVVERRVAPTRNGRGGWTQATATLLNIRPWTAHTAGGRQLLDLKEADRNKETTAFYVQNIPLYVADDNREADVFRYLGRRWTTMTVNNFGPQGRCRWALAVLSDVQEAA
jgi:hypothetical protein